MPKRADDKEDEAKLDAALAIAALSNVPWNTAPKKQLRKNTDDSRKLAAGTEEEGGYASSSVRWTTSDKDNHVTLPVISSSCKNLLKSVKRKRPRQDCLGTIASAECDERPRSKKTTVDSLQGRFVRSSTQTFANSISNEGTSPVVTVSYSSTAQVLDNLSMNSCVISGADDGCLTSVMLPSTGFQLVPLTSVLASGLQAPSICQPNDMLGNAQLLSGSNLLQFLQNLGSNFFMLGNCNQNAESFTNTKIESSDKLNVNAPQLPGSLSTLRDYYNGANTSESTDDHIKEIFISPASAASYSSEATLCSSSCLNQANSIAEGVPIQLVTSVVPEITTRSSQYEAMRKLSSQSLEMASSISSVTVGNGAEFSLVGIPGSLNILRSYYSSLNQHTETKLIAAEQGQSDRKTANLLDVSSHTKILDPLKATNNFVLNLSECQEDGLTFQMISGVMNQADKVQQSEWTSVFQLELEKDSPKSYVISSADTTTNGSVYEGQERLNSHESTSRSLRPSVTSSSPVRILPKISESLKLESEMPTPSHLGYGPKQPDAIANKAASVSLPPKKRKVPSSSGEVLTQLNACKILVGEETLLPLNEFLSNLRERDATAYQNVMNQIQSAIVVDSESSAKLPTSGNSILSSKSISSQVDQCHSTVSESVSKRDANYNESKPRNNLTFPLSNPASTSGALVAATGETDKNNTHTTARTGNDGCHVSNVIVINDQLPSSSSILLSSGQYPHPVLQPDEDGDLPLHVAVAHGNRDIVERLIIIMKQLNTSIDCRNHLRQTPLHVAVVTGNCEIVSCLLTAGASPNIADRKGQNCLHLAVQYRQMDCLECLFSHSEIQPDLLNYEGMSPLHLAVKLDLNDALNILLRKGARPDVVEGKSGHTALYLAANTNRIKAADILLSFGANPQIASYSGCSPVQAASSKSFNDMVKLLLKFSNSDQLSDKASDSRDSTELEILSPTGKG